MRVLLQDEGGWLQFAAAERVLVASRPGEVWPCLQAAEAATAAGYYAAGFVAYEAAAAFGLAVHPAGSPDYPLLCLGLYRPGNVRPVDWPPAGVGAYQLGPWQAGVDRAAYAQAIAAIKTHIARGETYQVNYTFPLRADFLGQPLALFADLVRAQQERRLPQEPQGRYAAFVDTGRLAICSASPELFFRLDGSRLVSRPMKGTAGRALTQAEDVTRPGWLQQSAKNRAENVMIVDMIRNDMGRVAAVGSVQVPALFAVERYPTVWQMTSTVMAETSAPLSEIMAAMFPCASITGAPKHSTMRIIRALEAEPRGVYTGAIGYLAPGRRAQFNVAIRTVVVEKEPGRATYGVGGGIVWDSTAEEEYQECQVKAQVLAARRPAFSLLETMLWTPEEGFFLLDYHLRRLADSAAYFGVPLDEVAVRAQLAVTASGPCKVRLLVAETGAVGVQVLPLGEMDGGVRRVGWASRPVSRTDLFLYHKTTQRGVYEAARGSRPGCDEVLLWNEQGELTEATTANVVVERDGRRLTPLVACGLLPGTYRQWLLDQGEIEEGVIRRETLRPGQRLYLINAVRRWQLAELVGPA